MGTDGHLPARWVLVAEHQAGQRLDNFLLRELKGVPRSRIYRLLRRGEVRLNSGRARAMARLSEGDRVRLPPLRAPQRRALADICAADAEALLGCICHEDERFIGIDKPAGLAVHGGSGLTSGLIERLRAARPDERFLELVHRLDRGTSGCMLVAKKRSALRAAQALFRARQVRKTYTGVVLGEWPAGLRTVAAPLRRVRNAAGERMVRVHPDGTAARTGVRLMRTLRADGLALSLVALRLHTGHSHQIRVHCTHAGHPLVGDDRYGKRAANNRLRACGLARIFLHSSHLALPELDISIKAPLPTDLQTWLTRQTRD